MKRKSSSGIFLDRELFESAAWRELNATAISVYLQFRKRCQMTKNSRKQGARQAWTIMNNGKIILTFATAERLLNIAPSTFRNALRLLHRVGILDVTTTGQGVHREPSQYAISDRWKLYGLSNFVFKAWPSPSKYGGFQKNNRLGRNCQKKMTTTVKAQHEPVLNFQHSGEIVVLRSQHGKKVKNSYKFSSGKWLLTKTA